MTKRTGKLATALLPLRAGGAPHQLPRPPAMVALQRTIGNRAVRTLLGLPGSRSAVAPSAAAGTPDVRAAAAEGLSGPAGQLPHLDPIRRAFGRHDVSRVQAHVGGPAAIGAQAMGAEAFATGDHVAFASAPSLHVAAHEAAHVVQQRSGVQLAGGVGRSGDAYERHADAVADAVVRGESAEALLDQHAGGATSRAAAPAVQRYERDEHADIPTRHLKNLYDYLRTPAGVQWAKDHGYQDPEELIRRMESDPVISAYNEKPARVAKLHGAKTDFTYGEVTAMMGDLFGHWESLYNADETQREHLMGEDSTASNEKYTHGEYLKLAAKNDSHFAGENRTAWLEHHQRALALAIQAGADGKLLDQALFIDAAGGHFLTDAFSSGHQFEKAKVFNTVLVDLQKHFIATDNKQMQAYVAIAGAADLGNLANLVVKAIHDKMNLDGFEVVNGKGMKWRTFGDGYLGTSPETQRIAALAVFESRQQVLTAHRTKTMPDVKDVLEFFPTEDTAKKATDYALGLIPWGRQQVENILYAQRGAASTKVGAFGGFFVEHNLEAIGDPARERNILEDQRFDREHGGPGSVMASQFEFRFGK